LGLGKNEMMPKPKTGQNFRLNEWLGLTCGRDRTAYSLKLGVEAVGVGRV
jgi:hypothetical protein